MNISYRIIIISFSESFVVLPLLYFFVFSIDFMLHRMILLRVASFLVVHFFSTGGLGCAAMPEFGAGVGVGAV
jgi:hypothetical protein